MMELEQSSSSHCERVTKLRSRTGEFVKSGGRKAKGSKHSRRFENLNFLLTLVDNEEFGDVDLADFIEPSVTAFSQLLSEKEKMEIWNEFISHTEEEQAAYLQGQQFPEDGDSAGAGVDSEDEWTELDPRTAHPACSDSPEQSFKRIDAKSRLLLQRRQIPKGILAQLENEVTTFFCEWPDSVYVQAIPSSFERLLLHAVCQYLDLKSKSLYMEKYKHTQVENKHDYFVAPQVPLSEYVEAKRH